MASFAELLAHRFLDIWREAWTRQTGMDCSALTDEPVRHFLNEMGEDGEDGEDGD